MSQITLNLSKELIEAAEREANKIGVPMVISIVDDGGHLVACHRMDDALMVSIELSQNKAWTSVAMKMTTEDLKNVAAVGQDLYGINTSNQGRIVIFGGGIPFFYQGKIIGAVGVSGGAVQEDIQVAEASVSCLRDLIASH